MNISTVDRPVNDFRIKEPPARKSAENFGNQEQGFGGGDAQRSNTPAKEMLAGPNHASIAASRK